MKHCTSIAITRLCNSRLKARRFDRVAFTRSTIQRSTGWYYAFWNYKFIYLLKPQSCNANDTIIFPIFRIISFVLVFRFFLSLSLFLFFSFISIFVDIFSVSFIWSIVKYERFSCQWCWINRNVYMWLITIWNTVSFVYFTNHFNASRLITRSRWNVRLNDEPCFVNLAVPNCSSFFCLNVNCRKRKWSLCFFIVDLLSNVLTCDYYFLPYFQIFPLRFCNSGNFTSFRKIKNLSLCV